MIGDWALLENNAFSSSQLLSLWEKVNGETKARLILILDSGFQKCKSLSILLVCRLELLVNLMM